jgi:hypothetical protein
MRCSEWLRSLHHSSITVLDADAVCVLQASYRYGPKEGSSCTVTLNRQE